VNDTQRWPDVLWLLRHGESAGNVARREAESAGHPVVDIATRDVDVPLSDLGRGQSAALGRWFGAMPANERPTVLLVSPYRRACATADILLDASGASHHDLEYVVDERLREREFGVLDRLTKVGVEQRHPDQAEFRQALGKFYHRPPGGESWCDVILRLRSVVDTISRDYRRERVLVVCHSVVVLCFRYLLEKMTEEQILEVDAMRDVANCGVSTYHFDPTVGTSGGLALRDYNFVAPLESAGEPITREPDVPVAPK
jgi:probable phosphoglycerate mutase